MHEITSSCLGQRKSNGYRKQSHSSHQNPCARLMLIAVHATRCQYSASQDVGMAECQDSSQLRVTYITNDCGSVEQEQRWVRERERGREIERDGTAKRRMGMQWWARWRECLRARARSVGGLMLQASHRLSSRRYADPAARLPYFNASVIGSPPATGILKASRATHRSPLFNPADQECLVSSLR